VEKLPYPNQVIFRYQLFSLHISVIEFFKLQMNIQHWKQMFWHLVFLACFYCGVLGFKRHSVLPQYVILLASADNCLYSLAGFSLICSRLGLILLFIINELCILSNYSKSFVLSCVDWLIFCSSKNCSF